MKRKFNIANKKKELFLKKIVNLSLKPFKMKRIKPKDEQLGALLKDLRVKNNLTQKDLAYRLGLKDQHVLSDYELGKRDFTADFIILVCNYFQINLIEFTTQKSNNFEIKIDELSIIDKIESADLESKVILLKNLYLKTKIEIIESKIFHYIEKKQTQPVGRRLRIHVIV